MAVGNDEVAKRMRKVRGAAKRRGLGGVEEWHVA